MNIEKLLRDDDAVSPVIGVILMVAITVILAAVIGTFVLGLGEQVQSTSPQASFGFDFSDETYDESAAGNSDLSGDAADDVVDRDSITITHKSGDTIPSEELKVIVNGALGDRSDSSTDSDNGAADEALTITDETPFSGDVNAGSSVTLDDSMFFKDQDGDGEDDGTTEEVKIVDLNGATISVVWQNPSGDSSATIAEWSGPSA